MNVLGLTFKEDCRDIRNTRVIDVIHELKCYGIDVHVHDPVPDVHEARRGVRARARAVGSTATCRSRSWSPSRTGSSSAGRWSEYREKVSRARLLHRREEQVRHAALRAGGSDGMASVGGRVVHRAPHRSIRMNSHCRVRP